MRGIGIGQIARDEKRVALLKTDSLVATYPHLVRYFQATPRISEHELVVGAHMAYGWMPRMLTIWPEHLHSAVEALERARRAHLLCLKEWEALKSVVNRSVVGASKLLHFVSPNRYPIWDSNVHFYLQRLGAFKGRTENAETYLRYVVLMDRLVSTALAHMISRSVSRKLGYEVTPYRAIELVMFRRGKEMMDSGANRTTRVRA
jgi:hypothetical protein